MADRTVGLAALRQENIAGRFETRQLLTCAPMIGMVAANCLGIGGADYVLSVAVFAAKHF